MKPSTPKGTRDFLPQFVHRRSYLFDTIRTVFQKYGFEPIETPALENVETLTGKYGDEGDKLIFKILQRGEKLEKALSSHKESSLASEALRYDLTVPFARFVVQHQNELAFPFRRYQIQPVWRADRPQRGRYREFYQCDADVVGTHSLRCEVEFIQIFDDVFQALDIPVEIRINNRKLLSALAAYIGEADKLIPLTIAIDKLDKMSLTEVLGDLERQGFSKQSIPKVEKVLELSDSGLNTFERLDNVSQLLGHLPEGKQGIAELQFILSKVEYHGLSAAKVVFDISLARGLNYYTGAIFEVRSLTEVQVGSLCGGGRYDDLTGMFGMPDMSGVGISFGADRIYDLLHALNGFPDDHLTGTEILFANFGEEEATYCESIIRQLRMKDIRTELYPENAKMKKQMKYADDKKIPFVALAGEQEIQNNTVTLKDMRTGEQKAVKVSDLLANLFRK